MDKRFKFGKNWAKYSHQISPQTIKIARDSLVDMFGEQGVVGKSCLDVGCGSGIFTIAAIQLGASRVEAFDYDPVSVATTQENLESFLENQIIGTNVFQGDILDRQILVRLGSFDIVYSWGVLHHTGAMWSAIENTCSLVKPNGQLLIAIYNDQGWKSRVWKLIKATYVSIPKYLRFLILIPSFIRLWFPTFLREFIQLNPFHSWNTYSIRRGMSPWTDVVDWVGGYPFEVATPGKLTDFVSSKGFELVRSRLVHGGKGCNELLFRNQGKPSL